jgi:hypothetical protein
MTTRPTIYRITNTVVNPSPGSGQYIGYTLQNGSLVPNPTGGIFSESLGNIASAVSDYTEKGFVPKMPSLVSSGLGYITKADDYTKVATNFFAGQAYETAIARGEAQGGLIGATVGTGIAEFGLVVILGFPASSPLVLAAIGLGAATGGYYGKQGNGQAAGAEWIRDNAPKLSNDVDYESAMAIDGQNYVAVMGTDTNGGQRTFFYTKLSSPNHNGELYQPVGNPSLIADLQTRTLSALGFDANISYSQYLVQNGLTSTGLQLDTVSYFKTANELTSPDGSTRQAVSQITTRRDEVTGAAIEVRVQGNLVNGEFIATPGSVSELGMDRAGRTVITGAAAIAIAQANNVGGIDGSASFADVFGDGTSNTAISVSIQNTGGTRVNADGTTTGVNYRTVEFKNARGDVGWILDNEDKTTSYITHLQPGSDPSFPTGGTAVFRLDSNKKVISIDIYDAEGNTMVGNQNFLRSLILEGGAASDLPDLPMTPTPSVSEPGFYQQVAGQPAQIEIRGLVYSLNTSGDYAINLGDGQFDVYDRVSARRFLEVDGVRIPVLPDQTIVQNDSGDAYIAVNYELPKAPSPANANLTNPQTTAVLNDISGLISAIQGGQSLPILNSGVRLINTFANPAGSAIQYPGLNQASGALNGLASLYNLSNALQNGSDLDKFSASLNTLNYVNSTLPSLLGASSALSPALNSFLNGTTGTVYNAAADGLISNGAGGLINGGAPGVIPVLGLIISIKNGDPIGTISGIIGIVNPALLTNPVGWILAIASIVYALNKETPESWGTARIIFDANGQVGIDTVGEGSGPQRVRQQLDATLAALNQQIAAVRLSNPNALIGIVPQRTPSITWREQRQDDQGYAIVDIDPVTGQQRYPYLRFDDNGVPFSSNPAAWQPDPRDPGIRVRFDQPVNTTYLIAAPAIVYWATGLKSIKSTAENDNFWRIVA